jgi:hypothetical protein
MKRREIKEALEMGCKPACFGPNGHLTEGITDDDLKYICKMWGRLVSASMHEGLQNKNSS